MFRPTRQMVKKWLKRCAIVILTPFLLGALIWGIAEGWTWLMAGGHCYDTPEECTGNRVAVVLGCAPKITRTTPNKYFTGRMKAAADLWHSGNVSHIIVSGDNSTPYYNEPGAMEHALVALGVPKEKITRDCAGLCTYDSVVRANRIFGAKKLVFVSQPSHTRRAVTIARHLGLDAIGLNAPLSPTTRSSRLRHWVRERGARVAMMYDLLSHRTPQHMGSPLPIPE